MQNSFTIYLLSPTKDIIFEPNEIHDVSVNWETSPTNEPTITAITGDIFSKIIFLIDIDKFFVVEHMTIRHVLLALPLLSITIA